MISTLESADVSDSQELNKAFVKPHPLETRPNIQSSEIADIAPDKCILIRWSIEPKSREWVPSGSWYILA